MNQQSVFMKEQLKINAEAMVSVHPLSHKLEFKGWSSFSNVSPALRATDYKAPHIVMNCMSEKIISRGHGYCKGAEHPDNSPCLRSSSFVENNFIKMEVDRDKEQVVTEQKYRIRKLTPRECFRLMDVSDEDIDKIQSTGVSKSQQYKLAGNSIVVNVLFHVFECMFTEHNVKNREPSQLTIFW